MFTERLDDVTTNAVVEHLLPGSSDACYEQRRRIAERYYDVEPEARPPRGIKA
jgi:hypothetical protein